MKIEETEQAPVAPRDDNAPDAGQEVHGHRACVLGIAILAILAAELSKDLIFSVHRGDWSPIFEFAYYGVFALLPFLLARALPKAASFDTQLLPSSRWHWVWFVGMLFLLLASMVLPAALTALVFHHPPPPSSLLIERLTPRGIVLQAVVTVLVAPVAEEIFFRGYFLEQLRKLMPSVVALISHALVFGLFHLYTRRLVHSLALFEGLVAFFLALILGAWRIRFRSLMPVILAHVLLNSMTLVSLKARYDDALVRSHTKPPTISRETTYITEPLREDGYVDYVAALDRRFHEGVTPENNSAVLFWKAMGPGEILQDMRERYFQRLGIPPLPEKGDYFVALDKFLALQKKAKRDHTKPQPQTNQDAWELLAPALKRPWSKREFPVLAAWLAANERPLALLVEASERPRRYDPLLGGRKTPVIAVLMPAVQAYRDAQRAMVARAMLRLNEGMVNEAWEDLLACHRLARLVGEGPSAIDALVAAGGDEEACAGDQVLLQHARLSASQATKMRGDLDRLPPMPKTADIVDCGERFVYLDVVSVCARDCARLGMRATLAGLEYSIEQSEEVLKGLPAPSDDDDWTRLKGTVQALIRYGAVTPVDWDLILRMANSWCDRFVNVCREPAPVKQREMLNKIAADFHRLKKTAEDTASFDKAMRADPHRAFSERLGQVLVVMFAPKVAPCIQCANRVAMRLALDKLAFALVAYHADHGSYPPRLRNLRPSCVAEVPKDLFTAGELHYRCEGGGFLLYSVGVNGRDDGGRTYEDCKKHEDWDDLVVRVPGPTAKNRKR